MTMPTFTPARKADQAGEVDEKPNVMQTEMGDGYVQRVGKGINLIMLKLTLSWTNLKSADGMAIVTFFRGQKGYLPFYYTINGETTPRVFVCSQWKWRPISGGFITISSATFEEAAGQ